MFGAAIMRRCSLGTLALVMLSGTPAQSAPQVTPNGFLVKFEVSVNAPAAKVYDALVGQVGSWWNPEHTYSHDAKNLSIDRAAGRLFLREAAERRRSRTSACRLRRAAGSFAALGSASDRSKAPVLPEA